VNCNLFEKLESDILEFQADGTVIVSGDLNARVGLRQDYIENDANIEPLNESDYIAYIPLKSVSQDKTFNC
jgi:hypothetical protein